jgi:hypothetical protein
MAHRLLLPARSDSQGGLFSKASLAFITQDLKNQAREKLTTTFNWCIRCTTALGSRFVPIDGYMVILRIRSPKGAVAAGFVLFYLDK